MLTGTNPNNKSIANTKEVKRNNTDPNFIDEISCELCNRLLKKPVTLLPCLHNFCSTCYYNVSEGECSKCHKAVSDAKVNSTLQKLVDDYRSVSLLSQV